jgi:hypothetical protein
MHICTPNGSGDSLATSLGCLGLECMVRQVIFFLLRNLPHRLWALTSSLFSGYRCYVPGVRQPEDEVDHSLLSNTSGGYTCAPIYMPSWRVYVPPPPPTHTHTNTVHRN